MKANSCGTMVEQARFKMGFKTAKERKADGADPAKNCAICEYHDTKEYTTSEGGCGLSLRCGHRDSGGFTTRHSAGCDRFLWSLS
ncbi:hypothetical protein [Propionivibrio sp.]|uniref:hypothetical protein n=1 Tax=Propionivibrio sp. TaxID=2212460 RepID=UPI003BF29177